jgi:ribosomal protein S18 acetylase RimI-like enzyme
MNTIAIHRVRVEEVAQVKGILSDTWADTYIGVLPQQAIDRITAVWHSPESLRTQALDPDTYFAVAEDVPNDNVVGIVTIKRVDTRSSHLGRLYIHPSYQRRGIGTELLEAAWTAFPGVRKMQLEVQEENEKGLGFFLRQGFRRVKTSTEVIEGVTLRTIVMESSITNPRGNHSADFGLT